MVANSRVAVALGDSLLGCSLNMDRKPQAQTHIRKVEKIRKDHNLGETKRAEELRQQKKPLSKKSKASNDRRTKKQ